jgi:hypothetical protein
MISFQRGIIRPIDGNRPPGHATIDTGQGFLLTINGWRGDVS